MRWRLSEDGFLRRRLSEDEQKLFGIEKLNIPRSDYHYTFRNTTTTMSLPSATTTSTAPAPTTSRLQFKAQSPEERYALPENFLEIEVTNPQTHSGPGKMYTDYEIICRVGRGIGG